MELILASTSTYRKSLLERLGVPFRSVDPPADEEALKLEMERTGIGPRELAERLALAKARSVAAFEPDAAVLGGDQVVVYEGAILNKPSSVESAEAQLQRLSGRSHDLITAIVVIAGGKIHAHTDVTRMTLRSLTPEEIHRYVEADQPLDCVGSYRLEARGIALFERIESEDHSAIIGMPLIALTTILRELGFAIP